MRLSLLGPVFWYEAVATSRRLRYFYLRRIYVALLLLMVWLRYQVAKQDHEYELEHPIGAAPKDFHPEYYGTLVVLQVMAVVVLTPALLAACIAQERDRKTIESLFVSDLSNVEIVFGKVAARLLQMALLLVAGLPAMAFSLMAGGIGLDRALAVFLNTIAIMVMLAGLSVGISTISRRARDAIIAVYVILPTLLVLPLTLQEIFVTLGFMSYKDRLPGWIEWLIQINPLLVMGGIASPFSRRRTSPLETAWPAMAWEAAIGLAAMGLAAAFVRRYQRWQAGAGDKARRRRRRSRPPLDAPHVAERPMLWKEMYQEGGLQLGQAGRAALWSATVVAAAAVGRQFLQVFNETGLLAWTRDGGVTAMVRMNGYVGGVAGGLALLGILLRAATSITSEKDRDCWQTLISSPIEGEEIVLGKFWGAVYSVRWLAGFAVGTMAVPVLFTSSFLPHFLLWCSTFAVLAAFASSVGIYISMRARTSSRATFIACILALVLSGGYLVVGLPCIIPFFGVESIQFALAPAIPFLGTSPTLFWLGSYDVTHVVFGYVLGLAGYCAVTVFLFNANRSTFDALAGRAPSRAGGPGAMNPAKPETAPAPAPAAPAPAPGEEHPP